MPTRGIIFDMDSLLIDSEPLWQKAETELLAARGRRYDPIIARQYAGLRMQDVIAVMQREYLLNEGPEILGQELLDRVLGQYADKLFPLPGATEAIHALGNVYPAAIGSNFPLGVIRYVVNRFRWHRSLRTLCSGEEVHFGKPAPDLFHLAAGRFGAHPMACCVLEDSLAGLRASKAAGMRCIAAPTQPFGDPAEFAGLADLVLGSLTELRPEMVEVT